jgi:serine/threonine protein kinase
MKQCPSCKKKMHDKMRFCPFDGQALIIEDRFIGTLLDGRYRLEEKIGEAEIAREYKATDTRLSRSVTVKLFQLDPAFDQDALNRLSMKLSATSSFYHPNIITIFDFRVVEDSPTAYLVFEFVEGITLKERVKRGRLSYDETLVVVEQVCSALESLHAKSIIHGNLNTEDIRLYGDNVRQLRMQVVDFDSLGELKESSESIRLRSSTGAEDYMPPERIRDESLNARSDIYSLGVIVYEMLSGRLPFEASTPIDSFRKKIAGRPTPLRDVRPDVSEDVEAVVLRALSERREVRQESATRLFEELKEAITATPKESDTPVFSSIPSPAKQPSHEEKPIYLDENVQFTVYRPNRVRPQKWYTMLAFAHLAARPPDAPAGPDPVEEVKKQAEQILADAGQDYRTVIGDSRLAIPREGELTMVPSMPGIEFNPPFSSFVWQEPIHRQEFRLRASAETNGKTVWGRLSVYLGSILLAEVGLSIKVDSSYAPQSKTAPQDMAQARAFRKIFASYSHKDISIVEQFERIALASGDEFIRDWTHLRAGEVWSDRLMQLIKDANIFQLFWSSNSIESSFVRQEWEYALSLNRANFIRPVYWEEPFPEVRQKGLPPDTLRRLQFHRLISRVGAHPALTPDEAATARIDQTGSPPLTTGPKAEEILCGNCGKSKPATTRFCPYCGAKGSQASPASPQPKSPQPTSPQPASPNEPLSSGSRSSATTDPLAIPGKYSLPTYSPPPPPAQYAPPPGYSQQGYGQQGYGAPPQPESVSGSYKQTGDYFPPQTGGRQGVFNPMVITIMAIVLAILAFILFRFVF